MILLTENLQKMTFSAASTKEIRHGGTASIKSTELSPVALFDVLGKAFSLFGS
jgi:hypothetical protein